MAPEGTCGPGRRDSRLRPRVSPQTHSPGPEAGPWGPEMSLSGLRFLSLSFWLPAVDCRLPFESLSEEGTASELSWGQEGAGARPIQDTGPVLAPCSAKEQWPRRREQFCSSAVASQNAQIRKRVTVNHSALEESGDTCRRLFWFRSLSVLAPERRHQLVRVPASYVPGGGEGAEVLGVAIALPGLGEALHRREGNKLAGSITFCSEKSLSHCQALTPPPAPRLSFLPPPRPGRASPSPGRLAGPPVIQRDLSRARPWESGR